MKQISFLIATILSTSIALAQAPVFVAEAPLPPVENDGFYEVPVSPALAAYLTESLGNVRIVDGQGHEIPFLVREEKPHVYSMQFRPYEILEKKQEEGCCTSLMLHNPKQSLLNSIQLVIKNADVSKEATLLGSDDKEHWFALKQHFMLYPSTNASGTSEIKIVDFPMSNYRYYSLRIADSTSAPLNILNAGYFEDRQEEGKYTAVPVKEMFQREKAGEKKTYVTLHFDTARRVDKLELALKGSPYFLRQAVLYDVRQRTNKKGKTETYYNSIEEIELNSRHVTSLELPAMKVKTFLLVIDNRDNPPLKVDVAKPYQLNRYLTAYLKKGDSYTLKVGEETLGSPSYDLAFFRDSIPQQPPVLSAGNITLLKQKTKVEGTPTFFTSTAFIWGAVVLVIAILGFMSVRLLKEAGNNKEGA
ncbi:hypothetical protein [Chryseolinea lacunae]|uniref:DUF3999 domain-containing protein n=1 Tax=Chryseolinea lacunae TaxID=2801331 RepID=A0ABS1KN28_9BACT|nr:hypothetical protein [Chryseolinea lacunae]MBL0740846.1 hypothetical protein [Chryseolinea lacunae]